MKTRTGIETETNNHSEQKIIRTIGEDSNESEESDDDEEEATANVGTKEDGLKND